MVSDHFVTDPETALTARETVVKHRFRGLIGGILLAWLSYP